MFHLLDRGTIEVQPAGPAGKRHVFLTISFGADASARQLELVLTERAAYQLSQALASGSVGVVQELNLADAGE